MDIEFFPIYFKETKGATNLKDLLESNEYSNKFFYTYFDKECTKLQCHIARRSVGDLYRIAKTYFPYMTLKEILKVLMENYNCFFCSTIGQLVFVNELTPGKFDSRLSKRYDEDFTGNDGWSYNKILSIINDENL